MGWYWADILFGGNLRRMYKTRADGRISTTCNLINGNYMLRKIKVRNRWKQIERTGRIPCNRSSSKLDGPKHQVMHLNRKQIKPPAHREMRAKLFGSNIISKQLIKRVELFNCCQAQIVWVKYSHQTLLITHFTRARNCS